MKEVISNYGGMIIASIVAVFLLAILFGMPDGKGGHGILSVIGTKTDIQTADYNGYGDSEFIANVTEDPPEIRFTHVQVSKNTDLCLYGLLTVTVDDHGIKTEYAATKAFDPAFDTFRISVTDILDPEGNSILDRYTESNAQMSFPSIGIYTVEARVKTKDNKIGENRILVPVDK